MDEAASGGTVFLLSPASLAGARAARLFEGAGASSLGRRLQSAGGVPVGELFAHISSLYFRGKLAYALHFGGREQTLVIVPGFGLVAPDWTLTLERARESRDVKLDPSQGSYRRPLERDAQELQARLGEGGRIVLLGSLATGKYLDVLTPVLGDRLSYPRAFRGLGEMQRGSLLLKAVAAGREFEYESVSRLGGWC